MAASAKSGSGVKRARVDVSSANATMTAALTDSSYAAPDSMSDVCLVVKPAIGPSRTFYLCQQPLRLVSPVWNDGLGSAPALEKGEKWHMIEFENTSPMAMLYLLSQFYPGAPTLSPQLITPVLIRDAVRLAHQYDISTVLQKIQRDAVTNKNFHAMLALDDVLGGEGDEFEKKNYDWSIRQNMINEVARYGSKFEECYRNYLTRLPKELLARLCFDATAFIYRDHGMSGDLDFKGAKTQNWLSTW